MKRTEPKAKSYEEILARKTHLHLEEINLQTFLLALFAGGSLFLFPASIAALFLGNLDLFTSILQVSLAIVLGCAGIMVVMMICRMGSWNSLKKQTRKFLKSEKKAKKMKKQKKFEARWDEL